MKTGIESAAYRDPTDLPGSYRRMRRHGYDCVDYQEFVDTETPLFQADEPEFQRLLREEAAIIRDAGLEISQTHGPWRYPPRDGGVAERAERFEKMARSLRGTRLLGCGVMVIHPIMPFGTGDEGSRDEFFAINFDFYRRLTRVAEDEGVVIGLENMPMPQLALIDGGPVQLEFAGRGIPRRAACARQRRQARPALASLRRRDRLGGLLAGASRDRLRRRAVARDACEAVHAHGHPGISRNRPGADRPQAG